MIDKRFKLVLLATITLLMVGLPTLSSTPTLPPENTGDADATSPPSPPESAYTYDPNQVETDGGNVGLYMSSEATTSQNMVSDNWTDISGGLGTRFSTINDPWIMELPTQDQDGTKWKLKSGEVTVSDMSSTDNFVPNNGLATAFQESSSEWTYPATSMSYTDNYWGNDSTNIFETTTQTYMRDAGYLAPSTEYVVPGSVDFNDPGDGAGYIELQAARRDHVFTTTDTKTSPTMSATNQYSSVTTDFSCYWEASGVVGSTLANDHYSANVEPGSTEVQYYGSNTDWAWGNTQGAVYATYSSDPTNSQFTTHLTRETYYSLYYSYYKSTTNGDITAHVHAAWDITQTYVTQFSMYFYYKKTNDGPTNAFYSANVDFTEVGNLVDGGRDDSANGVSCSVSVSGTVTYEIYKVGGTTALSSISRSFSSDPTTGLIDDTVADISGTSFGGSLTDTLGSWYEYRITVSVSVRTVGTVDKFGNTVAQGYSGTTTVSVPYTSFEDGVEVVLTNPEVSISESAKIDDPNQDDLEVMVNSAQIDWDQRVIPAGETVQLSYGYQVPDALKGYDGSSGSLGYAKFRTRLIVVKGTDTYEFIQDDQSTFFQVRGVDTVYGYGCGKFIWDMNTTVQAALNRSDYIIIKVGVLLQEGLELDYSVYGTASARVYFTNINFTVNTVPSAQALNLDLVFYNSVSLGTSATEVQRIAFVDDPYLPIAKVSFDNTSAIALNYWTAGDQGFAFEADSIIELKYTATFVAEYRYWDIIVHIVATNDTIYYEVNRTIANPKPYAYGDSYYASGEAGALTGDKWLSYWNDNFNITFIVPKYYINGEDFWNMSWAFDNNRPTVPNTRKAAVENILDWDPASTVWLEENPDAVLYSNSPYVNSSVIQAAHIANDLFRVYTSSTSGYGTTGTGIPEMDWDLLFYAPNDLGTIVLDDDTGYDPDSATDEAYYNRTFYSDPENDTVYVEVEKLYDLQALDANVEAYYQWRAPGSTTPLRIATDLSATADDGFIKSSNVPDQNFQVNNSVVKGPNWLAYGYLYVKNVANTTVARAANEPYLAGIYRVGLKYADFEVKGKSLLENLTISNTELYHSQNSTDYTYLFNSSFHDLTVEDDPDNMIKISIRWTDYSGAPISGTVRITINHYNYRDEFNNIVPKVETAFAGAVMTENASDPGYYYIWVDPSNMDNLGGNVTRGYHEFNITCDDPNYDPVSISGNFSIMIDTILEVQSPAHYYVDSAGRHHYDSSDCIAGKPYTIKVKYFINKSGTEELINNEIGSYYEGNVFMTYKLIAIHREGVDFDDPTFTITPDESAWDLYVNETYFADKYSGGVDNPYLITNTTGWATEGWLNNTRGDGLFYATFQWPVFNDPEYNNGTLTEYGSQTDYPRVLEYNISVYVRVNRTYGNNETFQPNDVEPQSSEGIGDVGVFTYDDAVLVREETILIKLNSWNSGNFTKVMLLNNKTLDGAPFDMGVYDPDEAHINAYDGTYDPTYVIRNYQNNATYESNNASYPNAFRLRVLFNCSLLNSLGEGVYRANWSADGSTFYPMGPLNATNDMYSEENITWMGDTEISLVGWSDVDLNFTPSTEMLWNTTVPNAANTSIMINATGITYVSPWLNWTDKPSGNYTIYIVARKKGFVSYTLPITVEILDAPTIILNGTKPDPQIPDDKYAVDPEYRLNVSTPTGIPVAFTVNFTDITNYYTVGQTAPVTEASIRCVADDNSLTWNNASGTNDVPVIKSTWYFKNLGNGLYLINVTYTERNIESNAGESVVLTFELFQDNYTASQFSVNITITKRVAQFILLDAVTEDYYYYYPRLQGASATEGLYEPIESDIAKITFTLALLDKDGNNVEIDINDLDPIAAPIDYMRLWQRTSENESFTETYSAFYKIEKFINDTGKVNYRIIFSNEQSPANYSLEFRLKNLVNYYDTTISLNATIKPGEANLELLPESSRDTVPYYRVSNEVPEESYLPYYTITFYDIHHNNTDNEPITFGYDSLMTVESNFTNPYRTETHLNTLLTAGTNIDARVSYRPVGDIEATQYIIDISGYETIIEDGEYKARNVNITFYRQNFNPVSIIVNFTITNASARIYLDGYDYAHKEEVYVRQLDRSTPENATTLGIGGLVYQSILIDAQTGEIAGVIPFGQEIYYGMLVQIQFGYFAYNTRARENILYDQNNTINLEISGETEGITVRSLITAPYSMIYFLATPTEGDYVTLEYNFTIWVKNYEPRTYYLIFKVVPHPTSVVKSRSDTTVKYSEQVTWQVVYTDESNEDILLNEHINIRDAMIYPYGNKSLGVASGSSGTYVFEDGQSCTFSVDMIAAGLYEITFDTSTLKVRDEPYYINLTIGKDHYVSQQILGDAGELPYFIIQSIDLQADVWLTLDNIAPDTSEPMPMVYVDPDKYSSIYVWVRVYVTLTDSEGKEYEQDVVDGISITVNVSNEQEKDPDTNLPKLLWQQNLTYDPEYQLWHANVSLSHPSGEGLDPIELQGVTSLTFEIHSDNPNYNSIDTKALFLVQRGTQYVPTWIYLVAGLSIGSVVLIGGFGVRKALQLRIPYVLRMIDESIDKISKDKFPTVGVMLGRKEFVINKVIDYLDMCGIEWAIADKFETEDMEDELEEGEEGGESAAPMTVEELTIELNKIEGLTPDERALFIEELKRLDRKGQKEFLDSLREG